MSICLKIVLSLFPLLLLATDAGHVDIVNGRVTITAGRVAIGPQGGESVVTIGAYTNTQNFTGFTAGLGAFTNGEWIGHGGIGISTATTNSPPAALRFYATTAIDGILYFPLVTNGMYYFEMWSKFTTAAPTNPPFLQRSTDQVNWSTVWVMPTNITTTYTKYSATIAQSNAAYFRIFYSPVKAGASMAIDDILWTSYEVTP